MRFEVPQFIEIEDKIFGPFTWRQFIYLCGGVSVAAITFITMHVVIFLIIGIPVGGLSFLLAFYPVNNRPFSKFLESIFNFYRSERIYKWRRAKQNVYRAENHTSEDLMPVLAPKKSPGGINSLARELELRAMQKSE
ncbi:MAG: hypothetical protein ACI92I_000277 [Acidimicrobiales bacterium]|jgi:hypothetical protein